MKITIINKIWVFLKWFFGIIFFLMLITNFNWWSFLVFLFFIIYHLRLEKWNIDNVKNKIIKNFLILASTLIFIASFPIDEKEKNTEKKAISHFNEKQTILEKKENKVLETNLEEKKKEILDREKNNFSTKNEFLKDEKKEINSIQKNKNISSKNTKENNQKENKNITQNKDAFSLNQSKKIKDEKKDNLSKVIKIVDGDTIKVLKNGKIETIRIIGINTPEIGSRLECFGNEAKNKAISLLKNKKILLQEDKTQHTKDKYYRLLAYVLIDGKKDFGYEMIKNGYAYEYTYDKPYLKQKKYKEAQKYAEKNKLGLWSKNACLSYKKKQNDTKTNNDIKQANTSNSDSDKVWKDKEGKCLIKGNISRKNNEKIYHLPGQQAYNRTKINSPGERMFCTEREAIKSGWRKAKQ